jgi:thiol-disulfide isomerase/thioredoxin
MTRNSAFTALITLILSTQGMAAEQTPPPAQRETGVIWSQSYDVGTKVAAMEKSPVLLFFTASWCQWCQKLERQVLAEPKVLSELRKFVCVKLDVEKNHDTAMAYGVISIPRIVIINTQGEIVGDWLGYRDASELLQLLTDIRPYTNATVGTRKAPQVSPPAQGRSDVNQPSRAAPRDPGQLTDLLGHKDPKIRQNAINTLLKGGPSVLPAMLDALERDYLGIRIAAWKIIRTLSRTDLSFDPWGPRRQRDEEVKKLREQLNKAPQLPPDSQRKPGA